MSQAATPTAPAIDDQHIERDIQTWIRETQSVKDRVGEFARGYPKDGTSITFDYTELTFFDEAFAKDLLDDPEWGFERLESALREYDYPIDIDIKHATARVSGLPEHRTFYPGQYRPSHYAGEYVCIQGEVTKATDYEPELREGHYECQRCKTITTVPAVPGEPKPEPHQCSGCERKGPFRLLEAESIWRDKQKAKLKTPPDQADSVGAVVFCLLQDDIAGSITMGDRVELSGILRIRETEEGFEEYLHVRHVEHNQSQRVDIDISEEERNRIETLASGAEGDPLTIAANSLHTGIHGHETVKKALILAAVGGNHVETDSGPSQRGMIHVLLLGDPSTGKSQLGEAIHEISPRSVDAESAEATGGGLTSTAVRDKEFGDGGWTINAGAFVQANDGLLWIDELDDLDPEDRTNMSAPMSKGKIAVNKAGRRAKFATRTTVVAAANPKYGRFDQYENFAEQFDFEENIISRFDLLFTFTDSPESQRDEIISRTILDVADAEVKAEKGVELSDAEREYVEPTVPKDILRKWIALARKQPDPIFADESVKEGLTDAYVSLRNEHYDRTGKIGLDSRDVGVLRRVAQAIARFELSETVEERHATVARQMLAATLAARKDEEGDTNADVKEMGASANEKKRSQQDRVWDLKDIIKDVGDSGTADRETVLDRAEDSGMDRQTADDQIEQLRDKGEIIKRQNGGLEVV